MGYAIVTRYHGPTNYRGSRVIGTGPSLTWGGPKVRATVEWDYGAGNGPSNELLALRAEHVSHCPAPCRHFEDIPGEGWGDSDANHRRAADAVVAKLRADGWRVGLDADDRGATLPDESGKVYILRYGIGEGEK